MVNKIISPELESIPWVSHGFFGMEGGVSSGDFASLNCALPDPSSDLDPRQGEDPRHVMENRRRALIELAADASYLVVPRQIHGADVQVVHGSSATSIQCDGLVTQEPRIALGVTSADCAPILFADRTRPIVAACHVGWRGALGGIIGSTVAKLVELGSHPKNLCAIVGPTIGPDSYEVGQDMYDICVNTESAFQCFFNSSGEQGRYFFDLSGFVENILCGLGIGYVTHLGVDTRTTPFFSRRRSFSEGAWKYGCNLSAIVLC